jgi:hypothetical protein
MNQNPWYLERLAEYERDRIQREIKQIRLEKEAMKASSMEEKTTKARGYRPLLLMRVMLTTIKWLISAGN